MKRNIRRIGSGLLLVMLIMTAGAVFSEPGSNKDPLVSVSYVDKKISELKSYIDSKLRDNGNQTPPPVNNSGGNDLEVIELQKGQSLIGSGGTEIILRSGEAIAIGSDLGGISDVTAGKDINSNGKISKNHLLIVPRNDGRGVYSKTETFYMVRGSYRIE